MTTQTESKTQKPSGEQHWNHGTPVSGYRYRYVYYEGDKNEAQIKPLLDHWAKPKPKPIRPDINVYYDANEDVHAIRLGWAHPIAYSTACHFCREIDRVLSSS